MPLTPPSELWSKVTAMARAPLSTFGCPRQRWFNPTTFVNFWVLLRNQGELQIDPELFKLLNYLTGRFSTRR